MPADGGFVDARFEPGGQFSDFQFTATAAATELERRVGDRFLALATANGDHFVVPGRPDTADDHNGAHSNGFQGCSMTGELAFALGDRSSRRLHGGSVVRLCVLQRGQGLSDPMGGECLSQPRV